nr:polysaccharide pyruvyl transferase family protein [Paraglaciecola sp. G1-23]
MNYGGILQSYALMETLKRLEHEPELLFIKTRYQPSWKGVVKKNLLSMFSRKYKNLHDGRIYKNTFDFVDKYIHPKTQPLENADDFSNIEKNNYDAYVVGSDQVWRARMFRHIDRAFFGFVKSDKPILLSYAPSFGVETWDYTEEETKKYQKQIQRFSGVSVREDSGVALCKTYLNKDAVHVLDPTMLLSADDYRQLIIAENEPNHSGGLLTYILDETVEKLESVDMILEELKISSFKINAKAHLAENIDDMVYPTVTSWLKGFDDAQYVITDSFHGCVFAILFNKPFIAYGNKNRGMARFKSLLKMFGLENRLVVNKSDLNKNVIGEKIDWNVVNSQLNEHRQFSKQFVIDVLNTKKI